MTHQQAVTTLASERYLLDEMTEAERSRFEEHYFSCAECADDVRTGAVMQEGTKAGLLATATVQTPSADSRANVVSIASRRAWNGSAIVPWTIAATLAMVVGYQSLGRVPGAGQGEPQALSPIALRPATRGAEPTVPIPAESAPVALVVDVIAAPGAELIYDLRAAEGAHVVSGRTQASAPGTPLLLLIPAKALNRAGHYVLTVAGTDYPFEVVAR